MPVLLVPLVPDDPVRWVSEVWIEAGIGVIEIEAMAADRTLRTCRMHRGISKEEEGMGFRAAMALPLKAAKAAMALSRHMAIVNPIVHLTDLTGPIGHAIRNMATEAGIAEAR
jgi:hypothetical protein